MYREAILKTIAYADVFDFPLSYSEIKKRLVGRVIAGGNFDADLSTLVQNGELAYLGGFYFLPYRTEILGKRKKAKFYSEDKLRRAERVSRVLGVIPWIRLIGITGAVAAENSKEEDDIDFFIITEESRLWITRFLVVLALVVMGYYRRESAPNNKICPNIFLDETKICWDKSSRNLYTANEVTLLKPLFDRNDTYLDFLRANKWCLNFLPNASIPAYVPEKRRRGGRGVVGSFIEKILMKLQLFYMRNKITHEIITEHLIHFKKKDNKRWVLREYEDRLKRLNIEIDSPITVRSQRGNLT